MPRRAPSIALVDAGSSASREAWRDWVIEGGAKSDDLAGDMHQLVCRRLPFFTTSRLLLLTGPWALLGCQQAPDTRQAASSSSTLVAAEVACSDSPRLQDWTPEGGWLAADYWMGALPAQMTQAADGALLVNTDIAPAHHLRVERNLLCGHLDAYEGGQTITADASNVRNVHLQVSAEPGLSLVFRLWDRQGGWLEWDLSAGETSFDLQLPPCENAINLRAIGGFLIEARNQASAPGAASLAVPSNLRVSALRFEASFPANVVPIAPRNIALTPAVTGTYAAPATGLHDYVRTPIHTVLNADLMDRFFQLDSACETGTDVDSCVRAMSGTVGDAAAFQAACVGTHGSAAACNEQAAIQAERVLTFIANRSCGLPGTATPEASYGTCGFEFMFGPDIKQFAPGDRVNITARLEHVAKFCQDHAIPFYIHVAGPTRFSITDPTWLGTALDHPWARGVWVAERGADEVTAEGEAEQLVLSKYLQFARERSKIVAWHRSSNAWWDGNLHHERVDDLNVDPVTQVAYPGIFSLENRDVLVPIAEDVEAAGQGLNASTVLGFFAAGRSSAIGVSAQSWPWENLRWTDISSVPARTWERMFVAAVATGSTYIQIEPAWPLGTSCLLPGEPPQGDVGVCSARAQESLAALQDFRGLVTSGILVPARRFEDLASVPKLVLQAFYGAGADVGAFDGTGPASGSGLFQGPIPNNFVRSMQTPPTDMFGLLYGSSHLYDELFPRTRYGLVALLAPTADSGWGAPPAGFRTLTIDGVAAHEPGGAWVQAPADALSLIGSAYASAAANLPITADAGLVSAVRAGADRYLVYLVDAEERFPVGAATTLRSSLPGTWTATDAITGAALRPVTTASGQAFSAVIPANGFQLVNLRRDVDVAAQALRRQSLSSFSSTPGADPLDVSSVVVAESLGTGELSESRWLTGTDSAELADFIAWSSISGTHVLPGDFDADGQPDFAITGQHDWQAMPVAFAQPLTHTFRVTNLGHQAFQALASASNVHALVGDFSGDHASDILLLGDGDWTTLPLAVSNRDGTFTDFGTATTAGTDWMTIQFAHWSAEPDTQRLLGDFNHDGLTDVALTGGAGFDSLPVAFSNGNGSFDVTNVENQQFQRYSANLDTQRLVGDFDADGRSDIVLAGSPGFQNMPVALSNGDGSFTVKNEASGWFQARAGRAGTQLLIGDFDADGRSDVAAVGGGAPLSVAFSNGDGSFRLQSDAQRSFTDWLGMPGAVARAGDFDGDGRTDIAITGPSGWTAIPIAFSHGDGTFVVTNGGANVFPGRASTPAATTSVGRF
jgi:VCBS repeat protein